MPKIIQPFEKFAIFGNVHNFSLLNIKTFYNQSDIFTLNEHLSIKRWELDIMCFGALFSQIKLVSKGSFQK